jgi:hypothetical protein
VLNRLAQTAAAAGDDGEARNLRRQWGDVMEYVAEHIGPDELSPAFLDSPNAREWLGE